MSWIQGYTIPFQIIPNQLHAPISKRKIDFAEDENIQAEISKLLAIGSVRKCRAVSGQFLSKIILADKPNGKKRFILILKELNEFLVVTHFKIEDARIACKLIRKKSYAATIDLKHAYYLLPIHESYRKYLRFSFDGVLYEFTCLPFGLSSAPHTFTKLMRPVIESLRANKIECVNYLDDFLILGSSESECLKNVHIVTIRG